MAIEKPDYQVLLKEHNFELRHYSPCITANVEVAAEDRREAANVGFSILTSYIFGNNISKQKISMTAPVTASPTPEKISMTAPVTVSGSVSFTISFMMPKIYSLELLPQLKDPRILFIEHPERLMAVIRFAGLFNEKNFSRHQLLLEEWLSKKGITPAGPPVIAGYDPPFTPWLLKHNEIMVEYPG